MQIYRNEGRGENENKVKEIKYSGVRIIYTVEYLDSILNDKIKIPCFTF